MPDGADGPAEVLAFERLGWVTNVPDVAGVALPAIASRLAAAHRRPLLSCTSFVPVVMVVA
jgi:hypothetical protein